MRCVEIFPLLGRMQTTPQFAGAHAAGAHICLGTVIFHRRTSSLTRLLQEGKAGPNASAGEGTVLQGRTQRSTNDSLDIASHLFVIIMLLLPGCLVETMIHVLDWRHWTEIQAGMQN